jgi:site-specific DNA recombinase
VSEKWGPKRIGGFNRTEKSRTYLFSGLLVCGVCGSGMTITGSNSGGTRPIYGCFAHRFRGASVCSNSVYIHQPLLEQQLINGITNRILRPDMLEYVLTRFSEKLHQHVNEMQKLARDTAAQSSELHIKFDELTRQAENIADAIAANGHRHSPTLLSRLSVIEAEIEALENRFAQSQSIDETPVSPEELRKFIVEKANDFQSLLLGDPVLAKDALRKHVRELVLTPRQTPSGPVFDVSGDIDLFAADSRVMQMVARDGVEPFVGLKTLELIDSIWCNKCIKCTECVLTIR